MKRYYLAYGSNLNVRQMKWRCPTAKAVGTAIIKDYELLFKGSKSGAYLTIEPKVRAEVPVAVWSVEPNDELNLDRYEGYPTFYYKKHLYVTSEDGRRFYAMAYIMFDEAKVGRPSKAYLEVCRQGYFDNGLDIKKFNASIQRNINEMYF